MIRFNSTYYVTGMQCAVPILCCVKCFHNEWSVNKVGTGHSWAEDWPKCLPAENA